LLVFDDAGAVFLAVVLVDFFEVLAGEIGALVAVLDFVSLFGVFAVVFIKVTGGLAGLTTAAGRLPLAGKRVAKETHAGSTVDSTSGKQVSIEILTPSFGFGNFVFLTHSGWSILWSI
jgi:hypothetical protein